MPIQLNDNIAVQAPYPTDSRYGTYADVATALSAIVESVRYIGLTAGVMVNGSAVEYWFKDGILDANFVIKTVDLSGIESELANKVDKIDGKGLSTNDLTSQLLSDITDNTTSRHAHSNKAILDSIEEAFTTLQKLKLDLIADQATKNQTDTYLLNRANHDGEQAISTITGLTDALASKIDASSKGAVNGVASLDSGGKVPSAQLPNISSLVLGETDTTAYRGDRGKIAYDHSQVITGNPHNVTKSDVGLGNVDNTSDIDKPISTATQTAINLKANTNSPSFTGTVSGISKSMVGLGNVDNTSDLNKPISTATQTALDGKISAGAFSVNPDDIRIYNNGLLLTNVPIDTDEFVVYDSYAQSNKRMRMDRIKAYLQAKFVGAVSTVLVLNLLTDRVLVSDSSGKIVVSSLSSTQLAHLTNARSDLQDQIDGLQVGAITGAVSNYTTADFSTANCVCVSDSNKKLSIYTAISTTELSYLNGVNSNIQTQFNKIQATRAYVGTASSNNKYIRVYYPSAYSSVPKVIATVTGSNYSDCFACSSRAITSSYADFNIVRVDSNSGWGQGLYIDVLSYLS